MKFLQTCAEPDCPNLVYEGRCREHAAARDREIKDNSPWRWVYKSPLWRALRRQVRREQLVCVGYAGEVCYEVWTVLDHKVALQDGGEPFARENVQGMCARHHNAKTADEVNARKSG